MILDGKKYSEEIKEKLKIEVEKLKQKSNFIPKLATILVGDDEASKIYVNMKIKACEKIGIGSVSINMPQNSTTEQVINKIEQLNNDLTVCGILLQHPTPKHVDEKKCFDVIKLNKDVDGVNTASFGKMAMGLNSFISATPLGIIMLLSHYNISVEGKTALVIGRSQILGKPISSLLLNNNATVITAHSKTRNLKELLKIADIVVACVGKPHFIKATDLKKGVVIVDAGYNAGNIGDVDLTNVDKIASFYTPVPGGVGPMTISALLTQTVQSFKNQIDKKKP